MDDMRKQLQALMGNLGAPEGDDDDPGVGKNFSDRDVCKHYLVGLCPHDLFHNTVRCIAF